LTTFHTDDTTGALLRMMDMGIDTFLISSTVVSVVSQRLIRKLCVHCRQPAKPVPGVLRSFNIREEGTEHFTFHEAKGCAQCKGTGFKGRTAIHELLVVNDAVRDAILARKTSSQIRLIARAEAHLISLREDGFYRATQGVTTLEEVARMVFHNESDELAPRSGDEIVALCEGKMLEEILPAELPRLDSVSEARPMPPLFASTGENTLLDGEAYRIRFDCHTIAGEEDRIADFFDAYQVLLLKLKKPIDSRLSEEFAAFIIETAGHLSTCEGAEHAEFSLQVQKGKVIILVESQLPPKCRQMPLPSRESGLGKLNYLR
jgi:type IV pilus assembly protein PilB